MLKIICNCYFDRKVEDITIIPMSFSYDRVLEADSFPYELTGESKVKESFSRVVKTI